MDGALRSSQRAGDPLAQASALRRSGQLGAARRVLQDAAREGQGRAAARLEDWYPLPPRLFQLLGWIESAVQGPEPGPRMAFGLACELLGCGDPRIDGALEPVLRRCLSGAAHDPWEELLAAWREPALGPRLACLLRTGRGARCLARTWLWESEALALAASVSAGQGAGTPLPPGLARVLLPLWIVGRYGGAAGVEQLEEAGRHPAARVSLAAQQALSRLGRPLPQLRRGLPATPAWREPVGPAWRDPFSGAWDRRFLRKHWQGSHVEAPPLDQAERVHTPALADPGLWVLYVDVDRLGRINDGNGITVGDRVLLEVADVLVEQAGDRVARWSGDEFMIHWEGDDGPELAEAIRAGVAALRVEGLERPVRPTVTVGVTRSGPFAQAVQRADQALMQPRQAGRRDAVCVLA